MKPSDTLSSDSLSSEFPVNEEWKTWNRQGFIPGEDESEEEFKERVLFGLNLMEHLKESVAELPFEADDLASKSLLQPALLQDTALFGIAPEWIPVFMNNHQLTPWQGGCAWIFQLNEQTPTSAFLQLRSQFKNRTDYLGIYNRNELLAHELAHAGRMMYREPRFEEILAYQTSPSKLRRFLGPIFQSSKESLLFILFLGLLILNHIISITLEQAPIYLWSLGLELCLVGLVAFAFIRLLYRHRQYDRCFQKLEDIYQDKEIARHLSYRLKDTEIQLFANSSPAAIRTYRQSDKTFRWKFLNYIYPL